MCAWVGPAGAVGYWTTSRSCYVLDRLLARQEPNTKILPVVRVPVADTMTAGAGHGLR
jgi:hypothetical protein